MKDLFCLHEAIHNSDYLLATYFIQLGAKTDVTEKAVSMAVGQTVGTWIPVPGISEAIRKNHTGRVVQILDVPPYELSTQEEGDSRPYLIQIAYPIANFGADIPMMLTTLLGNDASTSAQVKLVDLQLPESLAKEFAGPKYGIEGLRELTGVAGRPLVLNMIKPCTGFSPEEGAKIFYETARGGVDLIKDDELLGNPDFCPLEKRIKAYQKAAKAAYEETGHKTRYIANLTGRADQLLDRALRAQEAGADMVMVTFATVGYSMLQAVSQRLDIPVMGHYSCSGMSYEGISSGMSSPLALGRLPRLAGADIVMINTPYGGYPIRYQKYIRTVQELTLPFYHFKPALPAIGGGLHPGQAEWFIKQLGRDIILAPGGSVQGHPQGAAAGARAMRQAIDAALEGVPCDEAARTHAELQAAVDAWGYKTRS